MKLINMNSLNSMLGDGWGELLQNYYTVEELLHIAHRIGLERRKGVEVLPPQGSDLFFKIFKLLPPERIKVVILGQDPYPQTNPMVMTGIAFDCSTTHVPQPSLRNIIDEIIKEYPSKLKLDRANLMYLVKQGVFLVNTSLSVVANKPNSHKPLWKDFTLAWIKALQELNDKVWLLMGRDAQSYKQYITNPSHYIVETSHPSPLGVDKPAPIPFRGSNCFKEINEQLLALNKNKVNW
jgi:uracil-DNA glycosylase